MYQLKFTLKQHTPIIHFQHDQVGATLRATEVKPKLDRFIYNQWLKEKNNDAEAVFKTFGHLTVGYTVDKMKNEIEKYDKLDDAKKKKYLENFKWALDYKMRIEASNEATFYLPLARSINSSKQNNLKNEIKKKLNIDFTYLMPSNYFGNEDKFKFNRNADTVDLTNTKLEQLLFAPIHSNVTITIVVGNKELENKLSQTLNEFFIVTNFGTRQNKGFGCFTILESIDNKIDISNTNKILKDSFLLKNIQNNNSTVEQKIKRIYDDYQLLKSGTNQPYNKSELFHYFVDNGIRWEKRKIKQHLNLNHVILTTKRNLDPIDYNTAGNEFYNNYEDEQENEYRYIRALLGLAEHYEFQTQNRGRLKVKITHIPKEDEEKIERFQSPIFFKVIDNVIYLGINNSYNSILNKQFEFKPDSITSVTISTPSSFDIKDFVENYISNNWEKN